MDTCVYVYICKNYSDIFTHAANTAFSQLTFKDDFEAGVLLSSIW